MKKLIPELIKKWLRELRNNLLDGYAIKSYSQEGEDMILNKIFEGEPSGFYVDIGAHHPKRFSNTYHFYKKGWSGINIDAHPGIKALFDSARPRDINIEGGVSSKKCKLTYYMFNEPAFNTFDSELAEERVSDVYFIIKKINIDCYPISNILDMHMPKNQNIDFMSVDIEGYDLLVLQSNDWNKYRPKYIVVESYELLIDDVIDSDIYKYLINTGYRLYSKSYFSLIFKETNGYQSV